MKKWWLIVFVLICIFLSACDPLKQITTMSGEPTIIPTQTCVTEIAIPTQIAPILFIDPILPESFVASRVSATDVIVTDSKMDANLILRFVPEMEGDFDWVYVLAAPFETLQDNVASDDFIRTWLGDTSNTILNYPILLTQGTKDSLSQKLGDPSPQTIRIVSESDLLEPKDNEDNWAIIPFNLLQPKWKILSIDGVNILDKDIDPHSYLLTLPIGFTGNSDAVDKVHELIDVGTISFVKSNRDVEKMATIVLTGTTALTRDTGSMMDEKGVEYPARDIVEWLRSADLLHISHEISFMPDCDLSDRLKFCSKTEYIELFEYIGADLIELTGNHILDYGEAPFLYSLDLYNEFGMLTYGGGHNTSNARQPILLEVNGNRFAFIGCNVAGPETVWATDASAGAYHCDRDWISQEIPVLTEQGYNVIMTFQDLESCEVQPSPAQKGDFQFAAYAGAVIVSGSQAHCPQAMEFIGDSFVHYGLGNLFFDQMDSWQSQEFIDRYTFYQGELISIELLSAKLEEGAKPRPMTEVERLNFLYRIFNSIP